jgi:nucleotidyltransferase/DNA polymerase involved in DNA repair
VPELHVAEAAPAADEEGLTRLATWCIRYVPLVVVDRPDGVWIEVAGSAHLFGGEESSLGACCRTLRGADAASLHREQVESIISEARGGGVAEAIELVKAAHAEDRTWAVEGEDTARSDAGCSSAS